MPSDKKLRKQQSQLRKADADAERLRESVIAGEKRKQEKRQEKVAALTPSQLQAMKKAFAEEFATDGSGFVTAETLASKAKDLEVIISDNQIADLMSVFDVDQDGKLNEAEFAVWWTCGWSSLHQAFRQRELTQEINATTAANTGNLPQWEPVMKGELDATVGDIGPDFKPKASILAMVTPSSKEQYEAGLKQNIAQMMLDDEDEDENPPVPDASKTPAFLQLYAGVQDGASEEDVASCLEVLKAVLEEHSEQQDIPAAAKIRLMTNEAGKQCFHLSLYARMDKMSEEMMMQMMMEGGEGPIGAMLVFSQLMEHEAAQVDGFDSLMAGFDFGLEPAKVLSLGSNIPLLALVEQLRVVVSASATEHAVQMANFLVCKKLIEDGHFDNKRRLKAMVMKLLPNGAVRDTKISAAFASPQQVIDAALACLQKVPVDLAKDQYPDMTPGQLEALQKECADMTRAVKSTLQAKAPTDGTIKALTANPALRKFVNTPKNVPKVALVGPKGLSVNAALHALVDDSVSHLDNVPISVFVGGDNAKNRFFVADISAESQNLIAGFNATAIVGVVDTSSPEAEKEGLDALLWCSRFTDGAALFAVGATAPTTIGSDAKYAELKPVALADLKGSLPKGNAAAGDDAAAASDDEDSEDSDSEAGGAGSELIKQILTSVGKAVGTIDDIFVSAPAADLHLKLDNFNINALLPADTDELGLVRAQGKIVYQAVAQSAAVSYEQLKFGRIQDIMGRWQEELSDSDGDSDDDSDEEEEQLPTKPDWSEVYETEKNAKKATPEKSERKTNKKKSKRAVTESDSDSDVSQQSECSGSD